MTEYETKYKIELIGVKNDLDKLTEAEYWFLNKLYNEYGLYQIDILLKNNTLYFIGTIYSYSKIEGKNKIKNLLKELWIFYSMYGLKEIHIEGI